MDFCAFTFTPAMADPKDLGTGKLEEKPCECKEIEWVIDDFFPAIEKKVPSSWKSHPFSFNDDPWFLLLNFVVDDQKKNYLEFILKREKATYEVQYYAGIRNRKDKEVHIHNGILMEGQSSCFVPNFHCKNLLQRKSEFTPSDALTIIFTLKKLRTENARSSAGMTGLKLINLDNLSDNFKNLFDNKESCDTSLKVKDKEFRAHRTVLIARSSVFAATFKHDSLEDKTGVINIPDCDPGSFQQFLEYLYCGKLEGVSLSSALNLYYTSDKYDIQELKTFCIDHLIQCLSTENVCEIAVLADTYDELQLYSAVEEFFNENTFEILLTAEWDNFLTKHHRLANKFLKQMSKKRVVKK